MIRSKRVRSSRLSNLLFAVLALPMGEQVATLPPGRFMVSFMTLLGAVGNQFTTGGSTLALSSQFNRPITFAQVAAEDPIRGPQIEGMLQSQGVEASAQAGQYRGRFDGGMQAMIPLLGYGITERMGIFVTVPILKIRTQFTATFEGSAALKSAVTNWVDTDQASLAANITTGLDSGFEAKIRSAGYRFEPDSERTMIGDIQLVSPLILSDRGAPWQVGLLNTVSLPTGELAKPDDLYGIGVGSGRFMVGTSGVASYQGLKSWQFTGSAGVGVALPTQLAKRVPLAADDFLPQDLDPATQISMSPSFKLGVETRYRISRSWSARVGYQYQNELPARHSGTLYAQERYDLISARASQDLHTMSAGIDLSLIQAFLDGDFFFPALIGVAASLPFAGHNTMADPTCLIQTAFFF